MPLRSDGIPPCIPTREAAGRPWLGPRDQVRRLSTAGARRVGDTVRLFPRRGYDWSGRYPAIGVTAMLLRARSFTLDGEAVVCGPDSDTGEWDFNDGRVAR
jgi:hypothetical protein